MHPQAVPLLRAVPVGTQAVLPLAVLAKPAVLERRPGAQAVLLLQITGVMLCLCSWLCLCSRLYLHWLCLHFWWCLYQWLCLYYCCASTPGYVSTTGSASAGCTSTSCAGRMCSADTCPAGNSTSCGSRGCGSCGSGAAPTTSGSKSRWASTKCGACRGCRGCGGCGACQGWGGRGTVSANAYINNNKESTVVAQV